MSERKYFGTDGVRGRVGQFPITPEFAVKLGWAAGRVLAAKGTSRVLVGKDTRVSGYMLESALEAGLAAAGVGVDFLGPMPTPGIAYLTRTFRAAAGIVISASHNPYYDNGIKFFADNGHKLPDAVELEIERLLDEPMDCVISEELGRAKRINDAAGRYIEFCKSVFPNEMTLEGLHIVVDCAHGATYHIAPNVLRELGAEVTEIGTQPNGLNINKECGATHLTALQNKVLETKADLGIALDGDGDRIMMVTENGRPIDGDEILYMLAVTAQNQGQLQGGVVGTLMTNFALEKELDKRRIPFVRAKVGDRYVIEELVKRDWYLGGENSGHVINRQHHTTGDGIIAGLQVLAAMYQEQKSLEKLSCDFHKLPQVLINVRFESDKQPLESENVKSVVREVESALAGTGRVLLRKSGTEPLIRVMVEGENEAKVKAFAQQIANEVEAATN
ncbi:phosphoglucosamine mutase [Idiomarina loihiensis]|uniref:Phosphoglucosamine mutase n=1 Tax=Idiomarina loihiensis (strain ATCC BAA-735 / DSM 15497 / L2-TR) TaxID=283942 RepID=GLMM_IDILO|nr:MULTISPECIES: phosphoglucosamine mutase [Idiomarina]Q5R0R2.1 RecName: Full=Phosphoglucosamine mutase [Idiomarina loihiensis L2TR]NWO02452.1 phosphoglucosamine mutase [Idiomarinaceae bacterium]AAV81813.1 Phosphomannomutase family enzyme [Idiomarina loihiensis L2TR]AGM35843.1 phosphomannomutase [Idiomarina loihiensis GSL 199]MRJ43565.1 phosphoglucosamine mutase [Idiomarina loihiensis]PHQ90732.1 MAG: phosphoglucosamine mutase [Idiomarina sp.]